MVYTEWQKKFVVNFQKLTNVPKHKKIFLKAPSRIDALKTEVPGIPLSPTPILIL
jgi:hypothetical protein